MPLKPADLADLKRILISVSRRPLWDRLSAELHVLGDGAASESDKRIKDNRWLERCSEVARMVWVHLEKGNFDAARATVSMAERELAAMRGKSTWLTYHQRLEQQVSELMLNTRIINALQDAGITTVRNLLESTRRELMQLPGISDGNVEAIVEALVQAGIVESLEAG